MVIPLPKNDPDSGYRWMHFQGADLMAGAYRSAANKLGRAQSMEEYGEVFNELVRLLPQRSLMHHAPTLRAMCEAHPDTCGARA